MNITRALSISVSCLSLTAGNVFACSFSGEYLSAPPSSIFSIHEHTPQIRKSPHPRGVAESELLVDGNFQNQSSAVILGLDPRIQVKQGFLSHLDASVRHWHDSSFLTASVCFITDTGACSGNSFNSGANTEDGGHGTPGGSGDNSGNEPDYTLDNYERCAKEGYTQTACSSVQQPSNRCPYNSDIFEKCVCKPNLQTCTVPYYGVGEACGGKYASCERDDARACNENGTGSNASCPAEQTPNKVCPYNASYHDKCVCRSDLKTCTKPEYGVGNACGGKYLSCQRDDAKACKEDGYTQSAACSSTQQKDGLCPYNNTYYKQCVCKPEYKYACTGTGYTGGSGSSCGGKYSKCSCSASYEWTGSVCTYVNPCAGYYECGGAWQYCEGRKCSTDSTKCSTYCVSDYFPNSCDSSSNCNGIYRNGYCSGSCSSSSSGGDSGGGDSGGSSGGSCPADRPLVGPNDGVCYRCITHVHKTYNNCHMEGSSCYSDAYVIFTHIRYDGVLVHTQTFTQNAYMGSSCDSRCGTTQDYDNGMTNTNCP